MLKEHLLTPDYRQLSQTEAVRAMKQIKTTLKNLIQVNAQYLSKPESTYFECSLHAQH